jgi:Fe-S-cluster containining protein
MTSAIRPGNHNTITRPLHSICPLRRINGRKPRVLDDLEYLPPAPLMWRNNGTLSELPVNRAAGSIRIALATKQGYSLSVVTDLAEVFRLGTAKAEENLDFRRYLSAKHYSDKPFQILASEVQKQVDCTACANCCRHSVVPVSELEIQTVAEYLGATREAVTRLYTVSDPDAPALRILRSSMEGCVFLDGNLCMIYEARPKACRDFPHIAVGTHSLGGRQSSLARWVALCPIIFNALESYKHLTGYHPACAARQHTSKLPLHAALTLFL